MPKIRPLILLTWDCFAVAAILATAIAIPLYVALFPGQSWRGIDWLLTLVFGLDWLVDRVSHSSGRGRWLDWLGILPWHGLGGPSWLGMLRLVRVLRCNRFGDSRRHSLYNLPLRRLLSLRWMLLIAHWLACGWLVLQAPSSLPPVTRYLRALYWTVTTLTSVGYGDIIPTTPAQMIYAIVTMIIGAGLYTFVISNLVRLFASGDVVKAAFAEKLERVYAFMNYHRIPQPLKRRILAYYEHLWEHQLGFDETHILAELPQQLKTEVALFLKQDILQAVPIFQGAGPDFLRELANTLKPMVCLPGEYVFRYGQSGQEMYFISQGTVEILSKDQETVLALLGPGQFFGEIALLEQRRRNASARALELCRLYVLSREAFQETLLHYPEFAHHIQDVARRRRDASYSLSDPPT
ncbi:MAG: cyclic nucleotide-binding domain-containing protein [Thermostichales cyanobacterium BF4_bins_65]